LRALLIQMLYSIRSERLLMEEIDYNVLFRWFVGMNLDEPVWDATTFTKNRERLLDGNIAREFLSQTVKQVYEKGWASDEHFTVDGTLIEAWASLKSFQPKDRSKTTPPDDPGNPTVNFHGEKRSNQTHQSTTDADARLARKGNVARDRSFHPVRQYLESLKWDGIERLDRWLSIYIGAEDTDYTRAVGARWLVSAVARVYRPGEKAECCLILEGPQGIKKSTTLKTLGGPYFTDELADLAAKIAPCKRVASGSSNFPSSIRSAVLR